MDRKELIRAFFDNLKKTLNISSLYSKEHPLFLKAVKDFKNIVDHTLNFINPIQINIAIDFFLFDQTKFSDPAHAELAKRMHLRKIKRINIKQGITFEELTFFLNRISIPLKDFIKNGGIAHIKEKMTHLFIEEIDYWELLRTEGGENYKDIWVYLLSEVINTNDNVKIIQLAGSFGEMLKHFRVQEVLENNELHENIKKFLSYLKDKDKEKFSQHSKDITKYIFNIINVFSESELEKIRTLFNCFTESDFADILTDEILSADESDTFGFDLFFQIVDAQKHAAIASLTVKSLREKFFGDKQKIRAKIDKFLSVSDKYPFSEVYRNAFASFLKDISSSKIFSFDRDLAYVNYRLILLNLLTQEKSKDLLDVIIREISRELKNIIQNIDLEYLKLLVDILKKKKSEDPKVTLLFGEIDKQITDFVENNIWNEELSEDFQYVAGYLESSMLGIDTYLKRIFDENKVNATVLELFLKFFSDSLHLFYKNLEKKYSDIEFNEKLIKSLKTLNNTLVLNILVQIYLLSNNYIKIEVLRTMQELDRFDKAFLFSILQKDDIYQKEEALLTLIKDEKARQEALETLFLIHSPWGRKNKVLLDNIIVVEEIGLKEAKDYLVTISKKHFFWNRDIRRKAKEVLKKWTL